MLRINTQVFVSDLQKAMENPYIAPIVPFMPHAAAALAGVLTSKGLSDLFASRTKISDSSSKSVKGRGQLIKGSLELGSGALLLIACNTFNRGSILTPTGIFLGSCFLASKYLTKKIDNKKG